MAGFFEKFVLKPLRGFRNAGQAKQAPTATPDIQHFPIAPEGFDYPQLKDVFDKSFQLLEANFSQEHPDRHYLRNALTFKLHNTERIDVHKQEVSFKTYNTLFARTVADYMQREGLANVSVNTRDDPAQITLTRLNAERIEALYSASQSTSLTTPEMPQKSFVEAEESRKTPSRKRSHDEALGTDTPSHTEKVKRQRTESPDISHTER